MGRCYTISFPDQMAKYRMATISLNNSLGYEVIVHSVGDEFWIRFHYSPRSLANIFLRLVLKSSSSWENLQTLTLFFGQQPLVPFLLLSTPFFPDYSFLVHHPVDWEDRQLLSHAMASDFTVTWQFYSKITIVFIITDYTPHPYPARSLPAQCTLKFLVYNIMGS
jgi:hypothetical protein